MTSYAEHNIREQGERADEKLAAAGLILTQGGEPTFVPHDTSAPEWNIAALGPEKLDYARKLARALAEHQFHGGVILQSFGKQYPGESLPRWQIGIYRSRTGDALWTELDRLQPDDAGQPALDKAHAKNFLIALANALGLQNNILPVYENLIEGLRFSNPEIAKQILPRFSRETTGFTAAPLPPSQRDLWDAYLEPVGWVLPLGSRDGRWITDEWTFTDDRDIELVPGDSPIGLRLPLSDLPKDTPRQGLTAELRDGVLLIFLPPLPTFTAFAELVRTIEKLAQKLDLPPFYLEGYAPPRDDDLESIALTSDPGVIEVNLPPAKNWAEFEAYINGMYRCADEVGLRSYKYQLSGRQVGSGGGTHIVVGGPDLECNPFIEKPTLLSSFLRFLQHHPSLSYVFSGLFIGPSSQAPRVDESAYELPYELEITLRAIETMPEPGSPLEIDALLRNLLMDWNGNTHRAELSVDKFYNYNAPNGQLGLVEFRAFEMMPKASMLLAANVLIRALAASFAEKPFTQALVPWREALHDKYALPYFLNEDLGDVLSYLNDRGFSFSENTFTEQLDFRFPVITSFSHDGFEWRLRQALEPWPVMGEHEGTGRVVDSTTDRLELRVTGASEVKVGGRYLVGINGFKLPLVDAANNVCVGGIRYRLFDNPWGLQPHIRAHTPLQIRIIDTSRDEIVHAVDYANWKRDGGTYDGPPQTAAEAEPRVSERLIDRPELIGSKLRLEELPCSPDAPFTLDLRRS